MSLRRLALCLAVPLAAGCVAVPLPEIAARAPGEGSEDTALDDAAYPAPRPAAYSMRDPLSPAWNLRVVRLDAERVRMELRMKQLVTGGEGEARQVFVRAARRIAEAEGYVGYDVVQFEEGIESSWPFAQRVASGEVRLARSRTWPGL